MTRYVVGASSELSNDDSPRELTPQSDVSQNFSPSSSPERGAPPAAGPSSTFPPVPQHPGDPLPSVERDPFSSPVNDFGGSRTSVRITTPAMSLSPPPSEVGGISAGRQVSSLGGIEGRLRSMNVHPPGASSLEMSGVAAALSEVANGRDDRAILAEPGRETGSLSPAPRASRRRSSSRANVPAHSLGEEEPPEDRFHAADVQQAFAGAKNVMETLTQVLGSSSLHAEPDSAIRRLHQQSKKLANFQCPSTRTVGFVGDSGAGKSSLINSLLDVRGLARTSNGGAACTCVVTEYHHHERDDFVIDVELLGVEEAQEQVRALLSSYRHYYENGSSITDQLERKDAEDNAAVARDTFLAMFRGRLDSEAFLRRGSVEAVQQTLASWVEEFHPSAVAGRSSHATATECSDQLVRLTSEPTGAREPAIWPFIRGIKVYLSAYILSKGLVLVDLPGLRDRNAARRGITERYLLECNEIFAVCNIGRAATDEGVSGVVDLAKRTGKSNVGIVCTKSDDIRAEEAKRDWPGPTAQRIRELDAVIAATRRSLDDIKAELETYAGDDDDDLLEEERQHIVDLNRQSTKEQKVMRDRLFELKSYLIGTRNRSVTEQLNNDYRPQIPGGRLRAFCVSNKDYWENRNYPKDQALPFLHLSGILALRKHCLSIVAESQLIIVARYIRDDIPALIGDVELWVQSGEGTASAEEKSAVRESLDAAERRLKERLTARGSPISCLARSAKRDFLEHLYDGRRTAEWRLGAIAAADDWDGWHHSSYSAFCRNYGSHSTGKIGSRNWNEEALARMVTDCRGPWETLRRLLQAQSDNITCLIENEIDRAAEHLDTELAHIPAATTTLNRVLSARAHLIVAEVEEHCETFTDKLETLRIDALSSIRTSLIGRAMENAYVASIREYGGGSDRRRKAIIANGFGSSDLFDRLMRQWRKKFNELVDEVQDDIAAAVATHLGVIGESLDMIRSENIALESEGNPEFRRRVEGAVRDGSAEMQRLQGVFAS